MVKEVQVVHEAEAALEGLQERMAIEEWVSIRSKNSISIARDTMTCGVVVGLSWVEQLVKITLTVLVHESICFFG